MSPIMGYTRGTLGTKKATLGYKKGDKKGDIRKKRRHRETHGGHWGTMGHKKGDKKGYKKGYKKGDTGLIYYDRPGSDVLRTEVSTCSLNFDFTI
jgi:hypothetical protein